MIHDTLDTDTIRAQRDYAVLLLLDLYHCLESRGYGSSRYFDLLKAIEDHYVPDEARNSDRRRNRVPGDEPPAIVWKGSHPTTMSR